jgi:hypothetical protein
MMTISPWRKRSTASSMEANGVWLVMTVKSFLVSRRPCRSLA